MTRANKLSAQNQFANSIHNAMNSFYKQAILESFKRGIKMSKSRKENDCAKGRCIVKNSKVYCK